MKLGMRLPGILRQLLDLWQPSESIVLGGAAIGVGLASGIGVWLFKGLIVVTHDFVFTQVGVNLGQVNHWLIAVIPMVGGLVVGVILPIFIGSERHHGVAGVIEAVALAGGRLRYRRMPIKTVASVFSISIAGGFPGASSRLHCLSERCWELLMAVLWTGSFQCLTFPLPLSLWWGWRRCWPGQCIHL